MIEIKDLHKSYQMGSNSLHVLKGINFSVKEGELVSIMGSSGSGKSTLLNILGMLDEADKGTYNLDNVPIKNLNEKVAAQYRNKFLGFIFQSFNLINYKNALDNVSMPLYYQGMKRAERTDRAMHYLEKVGLAQWATHLPSEMSGGQKQRLSIARTLLLDPPILILDDSTSSVDASTEKDIQKAINKLISGRTVITIAHKLNNFQQSNNIAVMNKGEITEYGSHDHLINLNGIYKNIYELQTTN